MGFAKRMASSSDDCNSRAEKDESSECKRQSGGNGSELGLLEFQGLSWHTGNVWKGNSFAHFKTDQQIFFWSWSWYWLNGQSNVSHLLFYCNIVQLSTRIDPGVWNDPLNNSRLLNTFTYRSLKRGSKGRSKNFSICISSNQIINVGILFFFICFTCFSL